MLIWTLTFFLIHVCISAVSPKMLIFVILTSDLDPQGQRLASAVVPLASPSTRAPQARRPLSSAQPGGHLHGILCPQQGLSCPPAWGGHAWTLDRPYRSVQVEGLQVKCTCTAEPWPAGPRLRPGSSQTWTLELPSLVLRRTPRPPVGPEAQHMKQEMWLWPWSG